METDPKYEFEAPKWFDFTTDLDDEPDDDSSPNDLWFERVHPLHEPKDPSFHDATTKPLITTSQVNKVAPSNSKPPQTSKAKKNYNSKKSLGINSIRTRRGQHENTNNKESSGKGLKNEQPSQKANLQACLNSGKKDLQGSSTGDGRVTPDDIQLNKQCNFTPPWTNSPDTLNKTEDTPHANKGEESGSSLTNATDFSPRRVPAHQSTLSPARVRSLKSSTGSPLSPKSSLLSKAVNGNCHQASRCGRKRRLLPAIPDTNKQNPVGASGISSSPSRLPCQLKGETEANKLNDQMQVDSEEASFVVSNKPLRATGPQTIMDAKTLDQYDNDTFKREDKHVFSQKLQEAIPENSNSQEKALPMGGDRQRIFRSELETSRSSDTSLEALLKQHNKKIAAARSQYDENGRKIRTAEPNFCPAPSHKLSSSSSSSSACKRSTSSLDKPVIAAKQKRRSCVAAVGNVQSELAKSKAHLPSQTNKKVKETIKQTAKQKRRSCAAALQQSGQANNTEKELRDLIAQHNSRVNAKKS